MIGMTRAHIADPEVANKARQGRLADIRACIGCNQMCTGHREKSAKPISCVLNAEVGREAEFGPLLPAKRPKLVLVIGGGPAGMEAARVLALRGHRVALHERGPELGGQVLIAVRAPGREEYGGARRYLEHAIRSAGVEVHLESELTAERVLALEPDAVVVATGARSMLADVPGAAGLDIASAWDVLRGVATPGQNVVVIDGEGHIQAASTADLLASQGCSVEVITPFELVGVDLDTKTMTHVYRRLLSNGVLLSPHTRLRRVEGRDVVVADTFIGRERRIEGVDTLVLALGGSAENSLYHALKGHVPELYAVGDCVAPRRLNHAIHEGYAVARRI
jgi:NADPH-dependent 2,4-dienoyl-CoA reductase/sulfur reductase-like enzyme